MGSVILRNVNEAKNLLKICETFKPISLNDLKIDLPTLGYSSKYSL